MANISESFNEFEKYSLKFSRNREGLGFKVRVTTFPGTLEVKEIRFFDLEEKYVRVMTALAYKVIEAAVNILPGWITADYAGRDAYYVMMRLGGEVRCNSGELFNILLNEGMDRYAFLIMAYQNKMEVVYKLTNATFKDGHWEIPDIYWDPDAKKYYEILSNGQIGHLSDRWNLLLKDVLLGQYLLPPVQTQSSVQGPVQDMQGPVQMTG